MVLYKDSFFNINQGQTTLFETVLVSFFFHPPLESNYKIVNERKEGRMGSKPNINKQREREKERERERERE